MPQPFLTFALIMLIAHFNRKDILSGFVESSVDLFLIELIESIM